MTSSIQPVSTFAQNILIAQFCGADHVDTQVHGALVAYTNAQQGHREAYQKLSQMVQALVPVSDPVAYSPGQNAFVTPGYTSQAGNTYFEMIRLSKSIIVRIDVGIGYARTFCNAIRIYAADGSKKLLAQGAYHCFFYNESDIRAAAIRLVADVLLDSIPEGQRDLNIAQCRVLATQVVDSTYQVHQVDEVQRIVASLGG